MASEAGILLILTVAAVGILAIVAVNALAPRTGVAAPLLLVGLGVAVSMLPMVPTVEVEPEWILAGVLPPLLYSASVGLPTMDFRRDFTAISGLSVVLVAVSAVLLGLFFAWIIPGIGIAVGIALGAIVSPIDAVAIATVKRLGASPRVVTVLEGESLLNDATALVLLRSAIAATAMGVSAWSIASDFVIAVVVAVLIGFAVGIAGLYVRAKLGDAALSTAVSFAVPFVAYLPAEELGASGLVAVVTAGLVTGNGAAKYLRPQDRLSESSNWRTVELLLEGAVFMLMGLELIGLVTQVNEEHRSAWDALAVAGLAAVAVLTVRAAFVAPLLGLLHRRARLGEAVRGQIQHAQDRIDERIEAGDASDLTAEFAPVLPGGPTQAIDKRRIAGPPGDARARMGRIQAMLQRRAADIDYLTSQPLGWREGVLLVWAGMRGVVTLGAAQSLPGDTPQRAFLVLVAFCVAVGTLLVQGGSLPWLVTRLGLAGGKDVPEEDLIALLGELDQAVAQTIDDPALRRADGRPYDPAVVARVRRDVVREEAAVEDDENAPADGFTQYKELRLRVITAQRRTLLDARSSGTYSSAALGHALAVLDAEQINVEWRRGPQLPVAS